MTKEESIDRKDSNKSYTIDNCRFREFLDNSIEGLQSPKRRMALSPGDDRFRLDWLNTDGV